MPRKPKPSPSTLPDLVREAGVGAPGEKLIAIVEREIKISDEAIHAAVFLSSLTQETVRHRRMRLGRLLHWLRQGSPLPLGSTEEDIAFYAHIEAIRRHADHPVSYSPPPHTPSPKAETHDTPS